MIIHIKGIEDARFQRPLELIANLFFEESDVILGEVGTEAEAVIEFDMKVDMQIFVKASLTSREGTVFLASAKKEVPDGLNEKEAFKLLKNVVSRAYLTVLQDWTGMVQKWGILTGVRPTKLLHKKLREGTEQETAHKELKEQYLISDEKIRLMQEIVDRQLAVLPDLYDLKKGVSIYIGIPFCPTKCAYCTFPAYAINGRQGSVDSFLGGLHYEIRQIGDWLKKNDMADWLCWTFLRQRRKAA